MVARVDPLGAGLVRVPRRARALPLPARDLRAVRRRGRRRGIGAPAALSPKIGFCIADSFVYDSTIEHAGTFVGAQGSCADPNNDFVESDESNNETDVKVTISNGVVTQGEVRHPDTTPPPVTLGAPSDGATVSGGLSFSATTPVARTSATVTDGVHWLAARATDAQGRIDTSSVAAVTVRNAGTLPPPNTLAIDGTASADGRGTVTTQPLSTTQTGDLLLCLVSADGARGPGGQTTTVSGGGLTWSLVKRQNTSGGRRRSGRRRPPRA